jgi:hypothetical protein
MVQAVADLGLALPLVIPPQSPAVLVNAQTDVLISGTRDHPV